MIDANSRHWHIVGLWLAGLSLIPTSVVLYSALAKAGNTPQWWTMSETAIAVTCVIAALWAHTAALKALRSDDAKRWARHAGCAFLITAFCMSAVAIGRIMAIFLSTIS